MLTMSTANSRKTHRKKLGFCRKSLNVRRQQMLMPGQLLQELVFLTAPNFILTSTMRIFSERYLLPLRVRIMVSYSFLIGPDLCQGLCKILVNNSLVSFGSVKNLAFHLMSMLLQMSGQEMMTWVGIIFQNCINQKKQNCVYQKSFV